MPSKQILIRPIFGVHFIMYGELSAFSISSFIGAIIISIWTIFCLNKYEGKLKIAYVLISILAGISFLDLLFFLTQITHFKSALLSLPTLIIWDLGIFAGWVLFYGKTNTARIAYALISLLVCYINSSLNFPGPKRPWQ